MKHYIKSLAVAALVLPAAVLTTTYSANAKSITAVPVTIDVTCASKPMHSGSFFYSLDLHSSIMGIPFESVSRTNVLILQAAQLLTTECPALVDRACRSVQYSPLASVTTSGNGVRSYLQRTFSCDAIPTLPR